MSSWGDLKFELKETNFLNKLGKDLKITKAIIDESIKTVQVFYSTNKNKISLLSSKNVIHSFYDNSSLIVSKLISRNSKRLYKELKESKDLVKLLSQSTQRNLTSKEQKTNAGTTFGPFKVHSKFSYFHASWRSYSASVIHKVYS